MSYTPIRQCSLKSDGRDIYRSLEKMMQHSFYKQGEKRNIYLHPHSFDKLWETLSGRDKQYYKTRIPFFGHDIVRI